MRRKYVLTLFCLIGFLLLPVLALAVSMLPEPVVYAEAGLVSDRLVREDSGVELLPQPNPDYGGGGFAYKIYNCSDVTYRYQMEGGAIEVRRNDIWYQLKELQAHRPGDWDTGNLFPNELDWSVIFPYQDLYGLLPPGHYRVLNHIWPMGCFDEAFWVALEFDVTD